MQSSFFKIKLGFSAPSLQDSLIDHQPPNDQNNYIEKPKKKLHCGLLNPCPVFF